LPRSSRPHACAPETVEIILGDTDVVKVGGGSHSGLHAPCRNGVRQGAPELVAKEKGGQHRSALAARQIEFSDGRFQRAAPTAH
jgi:hypothetical protein